MRKKFSLILVATGLVVLFSKFSFKAPVSATSPNDGLTGAPPYNKYCDNCHNDFSRNSGGGSIVATGLPTGKYKAGQQYPFSITITQPNGAATSWGFSIKACNSTGTDIGTFSTTNPYCEVSRGNELKQSNSPSSATTSYTFSNLKWTAPASGTAIVNFYFAGVAADGDGSNNGDYVYNSTILNIALPVTLTEFRAVYTNRLVKLVWLTEAETDFEGFEIEKSEDGLHYSSVANIKASGEPSSGKSIYSFTDPTVSPLSEVVFYRLKLIDRDGNYEYSKVERVTISEFPDLHVKVYPTVIHDGLPITLELVSASQQSMTLDLYDIDGRLLKTQLFQLDKGYNKIIFQKPSLLPTGSIFLSIKAEEFRLTRKLYLQ